MSQDAIEKVQFDLPQELVSEAARLVKPGQDQFKVEGWRTSWLSRLSELLVGKD
jgi:hypothetical protein